MRGHDCFLARPVRVGGGDGRKSIGAEIRGDSVTRYFRSTPAVYADICAQLDAAYGYPNAATKTLRTLPLVADLPNDGQGRLYLAVSAAYCEYNLPSELLPQLIAAGLVEEITAAEYAAVMPNVGP